MAHPVKSQKCQESNEDVIYSLNIWSRADELQNPIPKRWLQHHFGNSLYLKFVQECARSVCNVWPKQTLFFQQLPSSDEQREKKQQSSRERRVDVRRIRRASRKQTQQRERRMHGETSRSGRKPCCLHSQHARTSRNEHFCGQVVGLLVLFARSWNVIAQPWSIVGFSNFSNLWVARIATSLQVSSQWKVCCALIEASQHVL